MLQGPATVNIWADDVAAAKDWYAELLGIEPYFERPGGGQPAAYYEFRFGDQQTELGIIDRRYAPAQASSTPGGTILHWHVEDVREALERLLSMGAKEYEPLTERGEGFVTASVVDPFGNVLGIMYNPHYVEVQGK
ncbi:VOC family protein [Streptomyces sp. N2-109]|uniref:VOC family protein n=1 Tax=Streptomyces gossypii TaxID=2883101 RepID=A0ABT2JRV1_9ACTN|nr:VOC family protein [Streptomyces gossypii]MCT2590433.1 VOC family protein [Streptomyces gossypii]